MAQTPKDRLLKGPYKTICVDCAICFSTTVDVFVYLFFEGVQLEKKKQGLLSLR